MMAIILFRLTVQGVLRDIPHDPSAFVTYALLLAYIGFLLMGARKTDDGGSGSANGGRRSK